MEVGDLIRQSESLDMPALNHIFLAVILVMIRMTSFLYMSPFFGSKNVSRTVRSGIVASMAIMVVPSTFDEFQGDPNLVSLFLGFALKEIVIGFFFGVLVWLPIRGIEFAGVVLDTQRGSTNAMGMDPIFGVQTTPTSILLLQFFSGYFFSVGGFLMIQTLLFQSFMLWPPTSNLPPISDAALFIFIKYGGVLLFMAFVFAMPISGFMVIADVAIAFVARSAPTLNALTFGMPVKTIVLLVVLIFYLDIAYPALMDSFSGALGYMELMFKHE